MKKNLLLSLAMSFVLLAPGRAAGPVRVEERGPALTLGNDYLERTVAVTAGHLGTTHLLNKISGSAYAIAGDEFELSLITERVGYTAGSENPWIVTARDLQVRDHKVADVNGGGKRVTYQLATPGRGDRSIEMELVYELKPDDPFIRQWVHLTPPRQGTYFIDHIFVAKNRWGNAAFSLGGYGQPLFTNDMFLGLEYPTSRNAEKAGEVTLGYTVGLNIPRDGLNSETAVIGVAPSGGVNPSFQAYVDRIRAAKVKPYILYNSWYDIARLEMTQENLAARVPVFKDMLLQKYNIHLDSFVLDDGWDDMQNTWALDPKRFSNGFRDVVNSLKSIDSRMGIWFGPIGGYNQRQVRVAAGKKAGLEVTANGQYFCIAGTNYSKLLSDTMLRYQKEYNLNYFKLDGMPFGCNDPTHGHPVGVYSDEAQARAFIDMLKKLRAQDPSVFINITTSAWLSPWWLKYADTVWMGGADSGYLSSVPALAQRQSAVSYRDSVIYEDFVANKDQFPISSIMTHGIIKGRRNMLGGQKELIDDWIDEVVHYMSVGNMMIELYISPDILSKEEMESLATSIHWATANQHPLLDNSTLVLGDPSKREPYGYVHSSEAKTIVTLRNPFILPQTVRLKIDDTQGFRKFDNAQALEFVYPYRQLEPGSVKYGDTLSFSLGGYEQKVFELRAIPNGELRVEGIRFAAAPAADGRATVRVYAPEGSSQTFRLAAPGQRDIQVDGQTVTANAGGSVTVQFGKPAPGAAGISYSQPLIQTVGDAASGRTIHVSLSAQVPKDYPEAKLAFLLEPEREVRGITAEARDADKPAQVAVENGGRGVWHWFSVNLTPGSHNVDFTFKAPATTGELKLSGWMLSKRSLVEKEIRINLNPGQRVANPPENLLPTSTPVERQTAVLLQTLIP